MDEKLSYKEFLDRNDSWPVDDRDLCLEAQPAFQPVPMAAMGALRSKLVLSLAGHDRVPALSPRLVLFSCTHASVL